MKFCSKLVHEINFEPDAVLPCCNIQRTSVPRFPYAGGAFDLDAYRDFVAANIPLLEQGKICARCDELREVPDGAAPSGMASVKAVSLNHFRFVCNCRCVYCTCWKELQAPAYSILPAVQRLMVSGLTNPRETIFVWGGGEPSILGEFEEACALIQGQGYTQRIHTNAIRHSRSLEELLRQGRGQVNSSLDAGSAATYQAVKGVDRWGKILETLRRYRDAALIPPQLSLKYIIFEANNAMGEIAKFFGLCADLGISHVIWSLDFREINAKAVSMKSLLAAAYFSHLADASGMLCEPFFVTQEHLATVSALRQEHFG